MKQAGLELYTAYLFSTFGQASAAGLSAMAGGDVSHDRVTRFLSERKFSAKNLWLEVKPILRKREF